MAVLSPAYLDSAHGEAEWRAFYANDPAGERGQLLPVRVGHVDPPGLLKTRVYVDLVGQGAAAAKAALLAAARGVRAKPTREPEFPGGRPQTPADTRSPRFPGPSLPVWNVPYRQNPDFIGREVALETLGRGRRPKTGASHIQVIHGMGGIGKTTLAVEYAYRHRDSFEVVWWVRAAEPATLVGDYAQLADTLGLAEHARAEQHLTVAAVRRWLEHHDRWLLILDNADDPQMTTGLQPPLAQLIDLLPQTGSGQLVVATRDASWDREVDLIELELLTAGEGVQFLLTRAGSNDRSAAAEVAVLLGHLPLAMEQAGAYVRSTRISLAAYLDRLRQFPALTLTKGRARGPGSAETVATTWQVSLDRVYRLPEAAALLELCVFLTPDNIPRDLFRHMVDDQPESLRALATDPFALDEAVGTLRRYGLVTASKDSFTVHPLLQQVVRDTLDLATKANLAGLAVRLLAMQFPPGNLAKVESWLACERFLPHILVAAEHAQRYAIQPAETSRLLDQAGIYLYHRGRYLEARAPAFSRYVWLVR